MGDSSYDVIIVGGGIIGCSTAYHLMSGEERLKLAVIEPDPTYTKASTVLSLANVRIQFSLKENIEISRYTQSVIKDFDEKMAVGDQSPHLSFRPEGNLFFFDTENRAAARQAFELQNRLGCSVEWLSSETVASRIPLYRPEKLAGATFGPDDGHMDPNAYLQGYKSKAVSLGAVFIDDEVTEIRKTSGPAARVSGVRLASGDELHSEVVINCAGAWAADIAKTVGVTLPIEPVKRQVFALDPAVKPESPLPLTILPSGLYFRTETGNTIVVGKSFENDPVGFDLSWDDKRFMETLWPELAEFVPAFDTLKLMRGWAGLYAVNRLDGNAILGEWPELKGLYLANGFSGHGLQQAPAVGRYLAESITGRKPSLDLSIFHPQRILDNKPLSEAGLV